MTSDMEVRFKKYEAVSDHYLTRRTPVIGRLDGRSFHSLTRGCNKPFDEPFLAAMYEASMALCKEIQGAKMAYTQSDEITILITDYDNLQSEPWFDYRINKMCSIAASIASNTFNRKFETENAQFDARFFNVPENDVCNAFIYRQQDCMRNVLTMQAQAFFSHKQLHKKNSADKRKMLREIGQDFENLPTRLQRGAAIVKFDGVGWFTDFCIPNFVHDRNYIEKHLPSEDGQ